MFSQIPPVPTTPTETRVALVTAVAGALAVVAKKFLTRRQPTKTDHITHAEFQKMSDASRDRVAAGYLALADKIDANHKDTVAAFDRVEQRLDHLEATVARLDERTKHR